MTDQDSTSFLPGLERKDGKTFEAVYFRPFNFMRDDKSYRVHAVQYVAWPDHTWEKLRSAKPGVYESSVKPIPDPSGWFHARVDVTKQKVSVWVDDAKDPCLVVDRLMNHKQGKVGLWVDSQEAPSATSRFCRRSKNLAIRPRRPRSGRRESTSGSPTYGFC